MSGFFIGVDIGGTFTDIVVSQDGQLRIHKLPSTPHDPSIAMLDGLHHVNPDHTAAIISHGTTVATNAILERKGARTAFVATAGFKDLLSLGRQNRPELYALHPQLPPLLVPRALCFEVDERLTHNGAVLTPLSDKTLKTLADDLVKANVESVAVCLLYSFVNPQHEIAIREYLVKRKIFDTAHISLSHEVLPQFREYERASTTALDAYVQPVMNRYLGKLSDKLADKGILRVMKSDGGVFGAQQASRAAAQTALSGPAAGVIGAFHLAKLAGYTHIITLDMGGTSTDVSLCPGRPTFRHNTEIDGLPLQLPMLDIETVGAGGGSIADVDAGGALRVGPHSAGAVPGPIVYGKGGQKLTVSDANAILGRLNTAHFLGGAMSLDIATAQKAMQTLASKLNLSLEATAQGIITIANINIERAIRKVSVARGYDPRDFTLVAFGGAGALHAAEVAESLGIKRVLVPRYPGVMCALGLLMADVQRDYSQAIMQKVSESLFDDLAALEAHLKTRAKDDLLNENISEADMQFNFTLDIRYVGQSYELSVPLSKAYIEDFHAIHQKNYGYALHNRAVEVVNLRLITIGHIEKPVIEPDAIVKNDGSAGLLAVEQGLARYNRDYLGPGAVLKSPALVFQLDSTIYIPDGWSASVDGYRNLILEYT